MSFTLREGRLANTDCHQGPHDSPTPTATKVHMRKMTIVEVDDEELRRRDMPKAPMRKVTIIEIDGE